MLLNLLFYSSNGFLKTSKKRGLKRNLSSKITLKSALANSSLFRIYLCTFSHKMALPIPHPPQSVAQPYLASFLSVFIMVFKVTERRHPDSPSG